MEGEYFFQIYRCPRTELEAATLKKAIEEDKSVWGNCDSTPHQAFAESFGPAADLAIKHQDSQFFLIQPTAGDQHPNEGQAENLTFRQKNQTNAEPVNL